MEEHVENKNTVCQEHSMRYVWGYFLTFYSSIPVCFTPFPTDVSQWFPHSDRYEPSHDQFHTFHHLFFSFFFKCSIYHRCSLLCFCLSGVLPSTAASRKRLFYPERLQQPLRGRLRGPMPARVWPPGHQHQAVPGRRHLVRNPCQLHRWGGGGEPKTRRHTTSVANDAFNAR